MRMLTIMVKQYHMLSAFVIISSDMISGTPSELNPAQFGQACGNRVGMCSCTRLRHGLGDAGIPTGSSTAMQGLNVGIAVTALIGFLESIAIAKAFGELGTLPMGVSVEGGCVSVPLTWLSAAAF